MRWIRWPEGTDHVEGRIAYGGDYNPEQWESSVWLEDARLMQQARVNFVTVGVFAWSRIQPHPDVWDFSWLDDVLDILHGHGVAVDLATATALAPPWLTHVHPEVAPVTADGVRLVHGSRQTWSHSSSEYRRHSLRLVERLAHRYANHPALSMWHISNEIGCHNARCYSAEAADRFRDWLQARYADLDALNDAWATDFWSQRYGDWSEIRVPARSTASVNPTQQLDFARFSSDQLRTQLRAEREILHRVTPEVPVTTNFMVMSHTKDMNYATWVDDVDVVSNDHYVWEKDPDARGELAFCADLTRGLAAGDPWVLMEHSTSAVNWQPVNLAKTSALMRQDSLAHVARGADAVCFFQWRQSRSGAERFHSAMVPHAGSDSEIFRRVVDLGADLERLAEIVGSRVRSQAAVLFDWESWWATALDGNPSDLVSYAEEARSWHRSLRAVGIGVDVVPTSTSLTDYGIVIVPTLYIADETLAARLRTFAESGGQLVVTYFSGIADIDNHVHLGGYPGAFRELLGIRVEEFRPLLDGHEVTISGSPAHGPFEHPARGRVWTEPVQLTDASSIAIFVDGPSAGYSAVTRVERGSGSAWYVCTSLDEHTREELVDEIGTEAGAPRLPGASNLIDVVRRDSGDQSYFFVFNHSDQRHEVPLAGFDLLTGTHHVGTVPVPGGGVAVIRADSATP